MQEPDISVADDYATTISQRYARILDELGDDDGYARADEMVDESVVTPWQMFRLLWAHGLMERAYESVYDDLHDAISDDPTTPRPTGGRSSHA